MYKDDVPNGCKSELILRSMIAQLLDAEEKPGLRFLTEADVGAVEKHGLKALSRVFEELVKQLPTRVQVFCIIEGLNRYHPPNVEELASVFTEMAEDVKGECAMLKVVMSTPMINHVVSMVAQDKQSLWGMNGLMGWWVDGLTG